MQCPNDFNHLQFNHENVSEWIRYADSKATFFLTLSLTIMGVSLTDVPALTQVFLNTAKSSTFLPVIGFTTILLLHSIFYYQLFQATRLFIDAVNPRLDRPSRTHSWYFFDSMATLTIEDFREFATAQDPSTLGTQLIDEIYNNCKIAKSKFEFVSKGIESLKWASLFGVLAITPTLIAVTVMDA